MKFTTRAVVCAVLLGGAMGICWLLFSTRAKPIVDAEPPPPPTVLVIEARAVPVQRQWVGFGTATAMDSADVPARVGATVTAVPSGVLPGTVVEVGTLLVQLDDTDFVSQVDISTHVLGDLQAQLQRVEIELESWTQRVELAREEAELARVEFERVKHAFEQRVAKQREVDQSRAALIAAIRSEVGAREELDKLQPRKSQLVAQKLGQEAALRQARENLGRCRIVSPLDGVLQFVDVEVGESLQVGQRVARIVNLDRVEVPVRLASSARHEVAIGDAVELRSAGSARQTWTAFVNRLAPEDDASTRTVAVYVEVARSSDGDSPPAPGTFLKGSVVSSRSAPRWVVPRRSIAGDRIRIVREGVLSSQSVDVDFHLQRSLPELGIPDRQWAVLRRTLGPGTLVMLNPSRSIPEGSAVHAMAPVGVMASARDVEPAAPTGGDGATP